MIRSALPRGMASRRSRVPEVRSRRVAMEVTRNIVIIGKMPSSEAPMLSKVRGSAVEDVAEQGEHHARDERASARWCAGRGGAGAGRGRRWRGCGRGSSGGLPVLAAAAAWAVAVVADRGWRAGAGASPRRPGGGRRPRRCRSRCGRRASGVSSARIRPSRIRRRRWQRSASSMTWEETRRVAPRSSARRWKRLHRSRRSTGSRPTVGSSRTRSSGRRAGRRRGRRGCAGRRRGCRRGRRRGR